MLVNRKTILLAVLVFAAASANAQLTKEEAYTFYAGLLGVWETTGKWETGGEFHQKIEVASELTKNIFAVKTYDYIDSKQFDNAQRNYGIRAWDDQEKKMKFWEFDVFGGITTGEIIFEGKNIYHVYSYKLKNGESKLMADAWIYAGPDTFNFNVCEFVDGKAGRIYLSSVYRRKN